MIQISRERLLELTELPRHNEPLPRWLKRKYKDMHFKDGIPVWVIAHYFNKNVFEVGHGIFDKSKNNKKKRKRNG